MRFQGVVYRAHDPRWSWTPVSGEGARRYGGRFNRSGVSALYTSLSPMTAVHEASPLGRPLQPILLCAYDVDAAPIFNSLDGKECVNAGVTDSDLHCPTWRTVMYGGKVPPSQAVADRLIAAGYAGMQVRGFAAGAGRNDINLVFWRWADRLPSRVAVIDDHGRLPSAQGFYRG
ncbi:MAG: RES domain-containing protein [Spirochaetaceae bacterium]|nr:RES domain-containing protein [Spirochaetaceae bacterium]